MFFSSLCLRSNSVPDTIILYNGFYCVFILITCTVFKSTVNQMILCSDFSWYLFTIFISNTLLAAAFGIYCLNIYLSVSVSEYFSEFDFYEELYENEPREKYYIDMTPGNILKLAFSFAFTGFILAAFWFDISSLCASTNLLYINFIRKTTIPLLEGVYLYV